MRLWAWAGLLGALALGASWGGGQLAARGAAAVFAELALAGQGSLAQAVPAGFPTRIGARLNDMGLQAPEAGLGWQVPQVQATAPLWAPLDWQAGIALPQWLTLDGLRFELTGQGAEARARFGLGLTVPLRAAALHLAQPSLRYEPAIAPSLTLQDMNITLHSDQAPESYRLTARLDRLMLPPRLAQSLTPEAALPDVIESLSLEARLAFHQPLALRAALPPALLSVQIDEAGLLWGGHRLSASGTLIVDPQGDLDGTITLELQDWPVWLELALGAGLVAPERRAMFASLGTYLAAQSGEGTVRLPLSFAKGRMSLAAIPLGPAPRLPQRQ